MTKRKTTTGLKLGNKTLFVNDILRIKVNGDTPQEFHDHPLGQVMQTLGYKEIVIRIGKHKWLELDIEAFIIGQNERFAEHGLIHHVAKGNAPEDFDGEYKEVSPAMYSESFMDTTFLRFLLAIPLDITKLDHDKFQSMFDENQEFYNNASREIFTINQQVVEEAKNAIKDEVA